MIALDTNLLVYAHRKGVPEHARAQHAIERAARHPAGWGIPLPCALEFWQVVTHPRAAGGPAAAAQAAGFIDALRRAGAALWAPTASTWDRLTEIAVRADASAVRVYDLQIALTARDHGAAEIWTRDSGFVSLRGLRVVDPFTATG